MIRNIKLYAVLSTFALGVLFSSNAYAARSSVSIMNPRNTVKIQKDFTYGYSYLSGDALDVYETPNRQIGWKVNINFLDKNFLRPVAVAYFTYVPTWLQQCVYNFNQNLREVNNTVNNLLIARPLDSSISATRFAINTTIGIAGCFDVAQYIGLEQKRMRLDTVLGKWGVDQGPYIVVPFYGLGTYRGVIGDTIDTLYFPFSYFPWWVDLIFWATNGIDSRSKLLAQDEIMTNSLDPYIQGRDFYLMYAEGLVNDGQISEESNEEMSEFEDYLDEIDE
jgi:phospholipid-binding lipoprotein MlaA